MDAAELLLAIQQAAAGPATARKRPLLAHGAAPAEHPWKQRRLASGPAPVAQAGPPPQMPQRQPGQDAGSKLRVPRLPPAMAATLSALPLATKQELLLALLRKHQAQRGQPKPRQQAPQLQQREQQPQPQPSQPLTPRQQQQRQQLATLRSLIDVAGNRQLSAPLRTEAARLVQELAPRLLLPASAAASSRLAPAAPQAPQRPCRPVPCRGSPSITKPLFLRMLQDRAAAAAHAGRP